MSDYGKTVGSTAYVDQLKVHQYIPQADVLIARQIAELALVKKHVCRVLDIGMGPGRLSHTVSGIKNVEYVGLDESKAFVEHAHSLNLEKAKFELADFTQYVVEAKFDVLFMQGVWHHVPKDERALWFDQFHRLTNDGCSVIVGDEFLADYKNEKERVHNAALFYLHIIDEAAKAGCDGLVFDESLNLLADVLYDLEAQRGSYDQELLRRIKSAAEWINQRLVLCEHPDKVHAHVARFVSDVRMRTLELQSSSAAKKIDRGDYKTSVEKTTGEFESHGWKQVRSLLVGPVAQLGGMGVLVFEKSS